jgi:hypothetical protein
MGFNQLFRARVAEGAVERHRIVKAGAAVGSCVKAAGPTEALLGTSDELDHVAGEVVDMGLGPMPTVKLGGTVAVGAALTSDAQGRAVATTTTGHRIIGFAETAGVLDDEIPYLRALGVY